MSAFNEFTYHSLGNQFLTFALARLVHNYADSLLQHLRLAHNIDSGKSLKK
jgi:hypothetical protein